MSRFTRIASVLAHVGTGSAFGESGEGMYCEGGAGGGVPIRRRFIGRRNSSVLLRFERARLEAKNSDTDLVH